LEYASKFEYDDCTCASTVLTKARKNMRNKKMYASPSLLCEFFISPRRYQTIRCKKNI
jgi:hypothetical protein